MPAYLYADNVSPRDRFNQLALRMDNGSETILLRGRAYTLTATEVARASRFIVLSPVGAPTSALDEIVSLPVIGSPEDGDVPVWRDAFGAFVVEPPTGGGGGGGTVSSELDGYTVDTSEHYRIIMLSSGTVRAIPYAAVPPATPTGLAAQARLTSVTLTWTAVGGAANYVVQRDGVQLGTTDSNSYRDRTVLPGATYVYRVAALDQYQQQSAYTSTVSAFINPALNSPPVVEITTWPPQINPSGTTIIRVNANDADAQVLALQLNVSAGLLQPTVDRSVWLLTI